MLLTKGQLEKMVTEHLLSHTVKETESFIMGMDAVIELMNKHLQDDVTKPNT